ncbi:hypothetical protein CLAFUW4_07430 [Fulvia fulva]|uniref:RRM domain-containing protein n=1 Tax=Passalora fulva TaxID=5499 RepID=A0A9Q8UR12_PASFU|nr:uncharacterized protein CLAFUR5_07560 [Fulvia fulva]KAK4621738.1 hypothetical protein CLAFUR4_07437 [Fulvia fulva]UJO19257.1 hypothetical protein CLAFUR5_07560 [Fulvia fulva]WPV16099.1 hypothetical protein CLAFUW4_07430 [Fulvia fulva]WPV31482.1 hypothetical protein CLAFUW7_07433 [Fulvia fulva]
MAVPLNTLVTDRPEISAVFIDKEDELPETFGQHLFTHHALHAICHDAGLLTPDEPIRGMAMGIWDGLSDRNKIFWTERAATAKLVRDREDFLLTDGSTSLARDHEERTRIAVVEYKRSLMSDNISIADTASIADTVLTEEDLDELDAVEPIVHRVDEETTRDSNDEARSAPTAADRMSATVPAPDVLKVPSDDGSDSSGAFSDRELRDLQNCDTSHELLDLETPATSTVSLPSAEVGSEEKNPAGDARGDAVMVSEAIADSHPEPSKPDDAAEAASEPGLISEVTSAASTVPAWIAQSLDWAEESQEQADRDAAAHPQGIAPHASSEAPAVRQSAPEPTDVDSAGNPSKVLWVGSLRNTTTVHLLKATFAKFGKVESAKVMPKKACGFVHFVNLESAVAAKRQMNGKRIINGRDPLLIRFAEDRSRKVPPVPKQRVVSMIKPGSNNESPQPEREQPPMPSGKSVKATTTEDAVDLSDNRSIKTTTSTDTRSTSNLHTFSTAQLEEAKRFASQATRGGKPPKGKPVTLSGAVENRPKKAASSAAIRKGHIANGPVPKAPQEGSIPVNNPIAKTVPLAKWEEPVKVRDFGVPTSIEPQPKDEGGKGKDFFLFHALPIVCEDLEIDEPDDYAQSIASDMWTDLRPQVKKSWIEDSRSLRGYSVRKPGLLSAQKRFQDSHFTKDYRSQILKALAIRNNGELKYLQPEFKKLMLIEKRRRKQEREREKRQLQHAAEKQAEAEEQKRTDSQAEKVDEPGEETRSEIPLPSEEKEVKQISEGPENGPESTLLDEKATLLQDQPAASPHVASVADPPPPYESDAAAGSSSEATKDEWKVAGKKSKSSANDTAKRAMKKMPWNKVAKG